MYNFVVEAKYVSDYVVWLKFDDNVEGEVNLESELEGEIYEPLKDKNYFKNFQIRGHTLSWENGADFAPEYLRDKIH